MTPSNDTRPSGVGEALLALVERCEKASGPDRELDCLILEALGYDVKRDHGRMRWAVRGDGPIPYLGGTHWQSFSRYTASLDAAMTLVPDNARLLALTEAMRVEGCATIWFAKLAHADRKGGFPATQSATPALALTAAALRARYAARTQEQHP